jgi:hypothetical protein
MSVHISFGAIAPPDEPVSDAFRKYEVAAAEPDLRTAWQPAKFVAAGAAGKVVMDYYTLPDDASVAAASDEGREAVPTSRVRPAPPPFLTDSFPPMVGRMYDVKVNNFWWPVVCHSTAPLMYKYVYHVNEALPPIQEAFAGNGMMRIALDHDNKMWSAATVPAAYVALHAPLTSQQLAAAAADTNARISDILLSHGPPGGVHPPFSTAGVERLAAVKEDVDLMFLPQLKRQLQRLGRMNQLSATLPTTEGPARALLRKTLPCA